jgi:hypothetical protein
MAAAHVFAIVAPAGLAWRIVLASPHAMLWDSDKCRANFNRRTVTNIPEQRRGLGKALGKLSRRDESSHPSPAPLAPTERFGHPALVSERPYSPAGKGSSTSFRCFRATHFHRLRHSRRIRFYCQGRECMVAAASRAVTPLVRGAQQANKPGTHLNRRGSGPAWRAISTRPKGRIVGPRCKTNPERVNQTGGTS